MATNTFTEVNLSTGTTIMIIPLLDNTGFEAIIKGRENEEMTQEEWIEFAEIYRNHNLGNF